MVREVVSIPPDYTVDQANEEIDIHRVPWTTGDGGRARSSGS